MKHIVLPILLLMATASCTKNDPVSPVPFSRPPQFTGEWNDPGLPMNVTISETDGQISGSGSLFNVFALTVKGQNQYPTITFTIGTPGYQSAVFTGTLVTKDSIVGTISGSGFASNTSRLKRIR